MTFEQCVTSVLCSSPMDEGGCVIQYGLDSSYQDLGPPVSISLHTVSTLPNIASSTLYYFTMNVTIGSTSFQLRRTLTTGEGEIVVISFLGWQLLLLVDRLTSTNVALLIIGVVLLFIGIIISVVGLILFISYHHQITGKDIIGTDKLNITKMSFVVKCIFNL